MISFEFMQTLLRCPCCQFTALSMDGASCTYLLGRKIEAQIPDAEIIARYVGAKHLQHT